MNEALRILTVLAMNAKQQSPTFQVKLELGKSGFFKNRKYIKQTLTTTDTDSDGQRVTNSLMNKIVSEGVHGGYIDESHHTRKQKVTSDIIVTKHKNRIEMKSYLSTEPKHKKYVEKLLKNLPKYRGVSIEMDEAIVTPNGDIIDGTNFAYTYTRLPKNLKAKIE